MFDIDYKSLFFCSLLSKTRDTHMATRLTSHVSRVSRLRRSRVRALLSLNLKKKRDCSQSMFDIFGMV